MFIGVASATSSLPAVSDGYLDGSVEAMKNISPDEARTILTKNFRPGRRTSINCYLIHSSGRLALVETGCGDYLQPSAGKLQQNLRAAGIDPSDIDTVILTHMHPDHSAGLTDRKTGQKLFPNADLVMHKNELAHWTDDREMQLADEQSQTAYFRCAREQISPYHNRIRTFENEVEVFPGVTSLPLNGHTPGHSGYRISSGNTSVLVWGDIIHVPEIQVPRPEVTMTFDTNPEQAAETRKHTFEMVATNRELVAGMHVHFPGFAHMVKQDESYLLLPEPWDQAFA